MYNYWFLFCYLGYKLFLHGFVERGGEISAKHRDVAVTLTNAAPGTFFSLFGAIIVSVTIWKGFDLHSETEGRSEVTTKISNDTITTTPVKLDVKMAMPIDSSKHHW